MKPHEYHKMCEWENSLKIAQENAWKEYGKFRARNSLSIHEEMLMSEEFLDEEIEEETEDYPGSEIDFS